MHFLPDIIRDHTLAHTGIAHEAYVRERSDQTAFGWLLGPPGMW
jgi:hypothetical protein